MSTVQQAHLAKRLTKAKDLAILGPSSSGSSGNQSSLAKRSSKLWRWKKGNTSTRQSRSKKVLGFRPRVEVNPEEKNMHS